MKRGEERRISERFDLELVVEVMLEDQRYSVKAMDISTGGMCLVTNEQILSPSTTLELAFKLPALPDPIQVQAVVRWCSDDLCGVQFIVGLRAREVWAINRLKRDSQ